MHGLIFSSLRDYSIERLGAEAVGLWNDRVFETTGSYDDEWFAAQLERLAVATGIRATRSCAALGHSPHRKPSWGSIPRTTRRAGTR